MQTFEPFSCGSTVSMLPTGQTGWLSTHAGWYVQANKMDLVRKLDEVNTQLSALENEKRELESNQSRISHILDAQVHHIEHLFSYQAGTAPCTTDTALGPINFS